MALKYKKRTSVKKTLFFLFVGFALLVAAISKFLEGKNIALLHSKGQIAAEQKSLLIYVTLVVMAIAVPTVCLLYFMAWKYRESNRKATHNPELKAGKLFTFTIWGLPTVVIIILAFALVPATHKLEPHKAIAAEAEPLTIQVVAMQWKWLFIYPEQQIATVNFAQIPKDTPVVFQLTADEAPMSSFWVPNLAGQLYAMTGHVHRLNLIADTEGNYPGRSAEINGAGFEGMKFNVRVSSKDDFESWSQSVRSSSTPLDKKTYDSLLKPTENHQITMHVVYDDSLYARALMKYTGSHEQHSEKPKKEASEEHSETNEHEGNH